MKWALLENIFGSNFYEVVMSNTSKIKKCKSLIRHQKLKIIQKLRAFS